MREHDWYLIHDKRFLILVVGRGNPFLPHVKLSCFADVTEGSFDDLLPLHANGSNNADTRRWITRMARFDDTIEIKVITISN